MSGEHTDKELVTRTYATVEVSSMHSQWNRAAFINNNLAALAFTFRLKCSRDTPVLDLT
jgi:hypothetical protein